MGVVIVTNETTGWAQLAPNAPADKVVSVSSDEQARRFEAAIAPYVKEARRTFPDAKGRFLAGLPPGETFFVTVRLVDGQQGVEIVFVQVRTIKDGWVIGKIANEVVTVKGHEQGDVLATQETSILDWTITKPDGSEEGNLVGKFLESQQ